MDGQSNGEGGSIGEKHLLQENAPASAVGGPCDSVRRNYIDENSKLIISFCEIIIEINIIKH